MEAAPERHFSGTLTRQLLAHVAGRGGAAAAGDVCARAVETRPLEVLSRNETWSSYEQFRRLAEAIVEWGGLGALRDAGASVWGSGTHPELGDALQSLGSPDAVLTVLPQLAASIEPLLDAETEQAAAGDWRVRLRFLPGYEPFRAHCAYVAGLVGELPVGFGQPRAVVVEESCQVAGAPACTFHVTWDPAEGSPADALRAELELRSRVLEARISALQQTVAELVSGESVDVVLNRVVGAAASAVLARGFVLAVDPAAGAPRRVYFDGVDPEEAEACAAEALDDGPPRDGWMVVDVASRRGRYGRLVALHEHAGDLHHQRMVLEAYGRVAAAALDSAAIIEEATRQAEMATALLELSLSLAEIGTSDEMAQRLASAVPAVVDCDQVIIALHDPEANEARIAAARGFGDPLDRELVGVTVPLHASATEQGQVRILTADDELSELEQRMLGRAAALASVPLHAGGEVLGWVAVRVRQRPERLAGEGHLGERLRGLAGQAATAMRNARLIDQIRFQAEHDPLTGLANQRLLAIHADQAIARAHREGARVGLLFLDLDDFKDVNDTLGHAEGDRLLQLVTDRLRGTLRESDTVARFGGDEFVVLLPAVTDDGAAVAAKIQLALKERFVIAGRHVQVTASIGRAVYPDDGADFGELLKRADIRMYEAKTARRQSSRSST